MDFRTILVLFIYILASSVCNGETRCYVCTTGAGLNADKCGDDFRLTSDQALTCEGTCQKTRGLRNVGSRKVVEVTRGCIPYTSSETCRESSHLGISATICTCNTYYCNSVNRVIPPSKLSVLLGCWLTFLLYKFL